MGTRRHATGGARLPGVMDTADGFGRRRVAARRAGATGGSGGSDSSSRAAEAPRVGRHAPSAKTRREASGTRMRKGEGVADGVQLKIK